MSVLRSIERKCLYVWGHSAAGNPHTAICQEANEGSQMRERKKVCVCVGKDVRYCN